MPEFFRDSRALSFRASTIHPAFLSFSIDLIVLVGSRTANWLRVQRISFSSLIQLDNLSVSLPVELGISLDTCVCYTLQSLPSNILLRSLRVVSTSQNTRTETAHSTQHHGRSRSSSDNHSDVSCVDVSCTFFFRFRTDLVPEVGH